MLIIGWLSSNPIIEASKNIYYVPLLYFICYFVYHVFGSLICSRLSLRLLLSPLPFPFCCHHRHPCSHQVQALMFPSPFSYPNPWHPHCLLTLVQNRLCRNVLWDRIMHLQNIPPHLLEARFLHRRLQWQVLLTPTHLPLSLPPCYHSRDPVLKFPGGPTYTGGHNPRLRTKKKEPPEQTPLKTSLTPLGWIPSCGNRDTYFA